MERTVFDTHNGKNNKEKLLERVIALVDEGVHTLILATMSMNESV